MATGLAEHFGVGVLYVRLVFVVASWLSGIGVIAYLLLWRFLPLRQPELSPGLEAATRQGLRTSSNRTRPTETLQTLAIGMVGVGVLLFLQVTGRGISDALVGPALVAVVGLTVIWRQFDDVAWRRWMRQTSGVGFAVRIAAGAVLIALAAIYFLTQERGWSAMVDLAAALGIALIGLVLILGPWITKLLGDLTEERRALVRSQERADVAAHLHDSVLQTLALLQKNAGDQAAVATLARRQERELRAWLYGTDEQPGDSLVAALRSSAADVEDAHRVPVEVIAVGDARLDPDVGAVAKAAREAMINAGVGFDLDTIAEDRMGVRGSIVDRVERHGGTVTIRSKPGEGTEVAMTVPVRSVDHIFEETS